ncbi:MAG TPA: hypothetical protein VFW60_07130 [Rhodanobacteraceae bacterium]|nr:hypothetical protein [Rhodanobacteraceae bacterium]
MNESTSHLHAAAGAHSATLARMFSGLTSAFGWLMCTLATGAVSAFAAIVVGIRPCWPVLVLALPLALVLRLCGCIIVRWAAPVAALAVLLAGFYAECLVAIARIAASTGFPFGQAFRAGGIELTLQVAELGLNAASILVYAAAAVAAAILATWLASSRDRP